MSEATHPAAADHLPPFITAPGDTDTFMVIMIFFLIFMVVGIGVFYFRLHALPEHIASNGEKIQFEIVAVLALLALFTHNHIYWVAALLLSFVQLPDLMTPLTRMADALAAIARSRQANAPAAAVDPVAPATPRPRATKAPAPKTEEKGDA